MPGWLTLLARLLVSPFGLLVGWTLLIDLLRHPFVLFRMSGIFFGMCLVLFLRMLFLLCGMLLPGLRLMIFGPFGVGMPEAGLFRAYALAGGPINTGSSAFLGRGLLRIRSRRSGAELLVAWAPAGCIVFLRGMKLIDTVLSFLLTLLFLLFYSFVGVLNLLLMFLRGFGVKGSHSLGGMLWSGIGELYVVMVHAVPFLLFILGMFGFLMI